MKSRTYLNLAYATIGLSIVAVVFFPITRSSDVWIKTACGLALLVAIGINVGHELVRRHPARCRARAQGDRGESLRCERLAGHVEDLHSDRGRTWAEGEPDGIPLFPCRCLVCGRLRSFDSINVLTRPIPGMPIGSTVNIQHCKDRDECWEGAKTHNPLPAVYPNLIADTVPDVD